jgi:non-ribosomal peptide synthetase component F
MQRFARDAGVTDSAVALAVLGLLLHRRSGRDRFVLSTAYANRAHPSTDTLVTCTATVLTLPLHVTGHETLAGLSRHVMTELAAGIADFLPYARIKDGLATHHGISLPTSLPLGATYQNSAELSLALPGIDTTVTDQTGATSRRDCSFHISPGPDGTAAIHTEYSTDLYRPETAEGWLTEYVRLLERQLGEGPRDGTGA